MAPGVNLTNEEYAALIKDKSDKEAAVAILGAEFADETCRIVALKTVLGYVEPEEDDTDPVGP